MVTSSHCPKASKLMSCHDMHLNERMKSLIRGCSCQSLQGYCLYACSVSYSTTATVMLYSSNHAVHAGGGEAHAVVPHCSTVSVLQCTSKGKHTLTHSLK